MSTMMAPQQGQHYQHQQQKPQMRPRSRGFSFKSEKSAASRHSKGEPLRESAEEKHRNHMSETTKANPNAAMNEIQPIAAALERPTIAPLRSISHVDAQGNPILEPDLSNPTRPRWERPLDTIRSFDNDIDREWRRRTQGRPESYVDGGASRRSSYYGGNEQNRMSQYSNMPGGGYYGGRNRDSYTDSNYALPIAGPSRNKYAQRQQSDPMLSRYNGNNAVYPNGGYQQSRDTVGTGESSASEQWNQSTNPSSENSSIDRVNAGNEYWSSGGPVQQPSTIHEDHAYPDGNGYPRPMNNGTHSPNGHSYSQMQGNYQNGHQNGHQNAYQNGYQNGRPPVPPHDSMPPIRAPIKLNSNAPEQQPLNGTERNGTIRRKNLPPSPTTEKRKSWFKRRFSKES